MSEDEDAPRYDLTIGELFPSHDPIARWVFSVTCLVEDLNALVRPLTYFDPADIEAGHHVAEYMVYTRLHIARLYEAHRLVKAVDASKELRDFTGGGLVFGGTDLRALYTRVDDQPSPIEAMYRDTRHRATHYSRVNSVELQEELAAHSRFPATLTYRRRPDGQVSYEYDWVSLTRIPDVWGHVGDPAFAERREDRSRLVGAATSAWSMCAAVAVMGYAQSRGIELERMVRDPDGVLAETPPDMRQALIDEARDALEGQGGGS